MDPTPDRTSDYKSDSLSLSGAIAMGTGVMIGAGIFALTGQIAELAGPLFPLALIAGAVVTGFSAYGYARISNAWPSSGGIAIGAVFGFERIYLGRWTEMRGNGHAVHEDGGE